MGRIPVPVSPRSRAEGWGGRLDNCRARMVGATPECAATAAAALAQAPEASTLVLAGQEDPVELTGPPHVVIRSWEGIAAEGAQAGPAAPYLTWFDSPAFWLYTSGTTGRPKAAMHRHGSVARVCETYAHQVLGITPEDRCYSVAKLFFAYGIGNSLFFPFSVGATAVLDPARATPAG